MHFGAGDRQRFLSLPAGLIPLFRVRRMFLSGRGRFFRRRKIPGSEAPSPADFSRPILRRRPACARVFSEAEFAGVLQPIALFRQDESAPGRYRGAGGFVCSEKRDFPVHSEFGG